MRKREGGGGGEEGEGTEKRKIQLIHPRHFLNLKLFFYKICRGHNVSYVGEREREREREKTLRPLYIYIFIMNFFCFRINLKGSVNERD
mgnify:FL=1